MQKLDNISFRCDCMEMMAGMPDHFFDVAIVDPPWGRHEHGGKERSGWVKQKNGGRIFVKDYGYVQKNWDDKPVGGAYFEELERVSKHQIVFGENYFFRPKASGRIIWDKCNGSSDQSDCEIAYNTMTDRVDLFRYMWSGMMQGKSVREGWVMQGNKKLNEKRIHPTQKPVNLYRWILDKYVTDGMKVLDTHEGSGSLRIAAYERGLYYNGCEIDPEMHALSNERFYRFKMQLSLNL